MVNNQKFTITEPEQMLTVGDIQKLLKCSKTFCYNLVNQEDFPKIKINNRIYVPVSAYNRWVKINTGKEYMFNT